MGRDNLFFGDTTQKKSSLLIIVWSFILIYTQPSISGNMPMMARVVALNISCYETGMKVRMTFDQAFQGIIFSKGHYKNFDCRYVSEQSEVTDVEFRIPSDECGSSWVNTSDRQSLENTIIIQHDGIVQEPWDEARQLRCDWLSQTERRLNFRPVVVASLNVREMAFEAEAVACWMDIQTGQGPFSDSLDEAVHLGETLSLVVYARSQNRSFDLQVKECYASDSQVASLDGNSSTTIQLTDSRGCPLRPKLLGHFFATRESGVRSRTDHTILAFAIMNAFKFPDTNEVYLSCNVAICRERCPASCLQLLTDSRIQLGQTLVPDSSFTTTVRSPPSTTLRSKTGRKNQRPAASSKTANGRSAIAASASSLLLSNNPLKRIIPVNDPVSEELAARVGLKLKSLSEEVPTNNHRPKRFAGLVNLESEKPHRVGSLNRNGTQTTFRIFHKKPSGMFRIKNSLDLDNPQASTIYSQHHQGSNFLTKITMLNFTSNDTAVKEVGHIKDTVLPILKNPIAYHRVLPSKNYLLELNMNHNHSRITERGNELIIEPQNLTYTGLIIFLDHRTKYNQNETLSHSAVHHLFLPNLKSQDTFDQKPKVFYVVLPVRDEVFWADGIYLSFTSILMGLIMFASLNAIMYSIILIWYRYNGNRFSGSKVLQA